MRLSPNTFRKTYSGPIAAGASVTKTWTADVPAIATAGQKHLISRVVNAGPDGSVANSVKAATDTESGTLRDGGKIACEIAHNGQAATLLRARYLLPSIRSITKTDGLTFKVREIVDGVNRLLAP